MSFTCHVGQRKIRGIVKEKNAAKDIYDDAVSRGETAGLLTQLPEAADVFSTKLGNIPANETIVVEIEYVGELKYDAETEGIRYTIPTAISPRYGQQQTNWQNLPVSYKPNGGFKVTVNVSMAEGSFIQNIQSPSHCIEVTLGTLSTSLDSDPVMHRASATLALGSTTLDKDFVLVVKVKDTDIPKALIETHPTIENHRALMVTLVPKFSLPAFRPEVIFVVDRSGSMKSNIPTLINAIKVYLKSLPVGVKFNICSFGSTHSFLWPRSKSYTYENLDEAISHVEKFQANMGGTEISAAIESAIKSRYHDLPCEIMLLTDGEIWQQEELFTLLNEQVVMSKGGLRLFSLGIGDASSSLIEGVARAGNGFAQTVGLGEKMDVKIIRMLKGALSPHISDYTLEVNYNGAKSDNDIQDVDYEIIDKVNDDMKVLLSDPPNDEKPHEQERQTPISLFDESICSDKYTDMIKNEDKDRYSHLPQLPFPKLLQAPHKIPPLFPFTRSNVYLLMSPETVQKAPTSVVLKATSQYGPLRLEVPVESLSQPGETLHQLAAKKAMQDLQEGRGWIFDVKKENGNLIKESFPGRFGDMVEREAVRLGVQFQVAGKWCSFVAVSDNSDDIDSKDMSKFRGNLSSLKDIGGNVGRASGRGTILFGTRGGTGPARPSFMPTPTMFNAQSATPLNYDARGSIESSSTLQSSRLSSGLFSKNSSASGTLFGSQSMPFGGQSSMSSHTGNFFAAPVVQSSRPSSGLFSINSSAPGAPTGSQNMTFGGQGSKSSHAGNFFAAPVAASANFRSQSPTPKQASTPLSSNEKVHAIISLQSFKGTWLSSDRLGELLGLQVEEMKHLPQTDVFVTILVITFLEGHLKSEEGVWELVVEKAKAYLDSEEKGWSGGVHEQGAKKVLGLA